MTFSVGDRVQLIRGRPEHRKALGVGVIVNVTRARIVVLWPISRRPRNHLIASLTRAY
jgi:hypothetical protein